MKTFLIIYILPLVINLVCIWAENWECTDKEEQAADIAIAFFPFANTIMAMCRIAFYIAGFFFAMWDFRKK